MSLNFLFLLLQRFPLEIKNEKERIKITKEKMNKLSIFLASLFVFKLRGRKIELHNKKGEITGHAIVSSRNYKHLNRFRWCLSGKYASGCIERKSWLLHRYVEIVLKGTKISPKERVDHINRNTIDCRCSNLRPLLPRADRNKSKQKGKTSKHYGVCLDNRIKKWKAHITVNGKKYNAYYDKEEHASYQYDLWVEQFHLTTAPKNHVQKPSDFVVWKSRREGRELPKNISKNGNGFMVKISNKYYGTYKTVERAKEILKKELKLLKEEREKEIKRTPIIRDEQGIPIIKLFNKNGKHIASTKVDEDKYYELMKYSWNLTSYGYVQGDVNGKVIQMSHYVIEYDGDDVVDHLYGDILDNRRKNLEIATYEENSSHKLIAKNNTTGCTGIRCYEQGIKKWESFITINSKRKAKCFKTKEEAIKQRKEWEKEWREKILEERKGRSE
jgi:hypothetical protein